MQPVIFNLDKAKSSSIQNPKLKVIILLYINCSIEGRGRAAGKYSVLARVRPGKWTFMLKHNSKLLEKLVGEGYDAAVVRPKLNCSLG